LEKEESNTNISMKIKMIILIFVYNICKKVLNKLNVGKYSDPSCLESILLAPVAKDCDNCVYVTDLDVLLQNTAEGSAGAADKTRGIGACSCT
jgi:hypothetical protein